MSLTFTAVAVRGAVVRGAGAGQPAAGAVDGGGRRRGSGVVGVGLGCSGRLVADFDSRRRRGRFVDGSGCRRRLPVADRLCLGLGLGELAAAASNGAH